MRVKSLKVLILSALLSGCIGSQLPYSLAKPGVTENSVSGEVITTDGQILNLADLKNENVVVMFAQFYCDTCKNEAQGVLKSLGKPPVLPTNAKLITVLVASDVEEARDWKIRESVPWTVAAIEGKDLIRNYCPQGLPPCTVVQKKNAKSKNDIWIKSGEVHPQEIFNIIGGWYE